MKKVQNEASVDTGVNQYIMRMAGANGQNHYTTAHYSLTSTTIHLCNRTYNQKKQQSCAYKEDITSHDHSQ